MVDRSAIQLQATNARLNLQMWGLKVFNHEDNATFNPAQWSQRLHEARTANGWDGSSEEHDLGQGGPGYVAAVCVRDHWDEMSDDERDWCVEVICSEVEQTGDDWNQFARCQRHSMSADRPCASVLPLLIGESLSDKQRTRVRHMLTIALTHAINEVRWHAAWGIGSYLWGIDRALALRCVKALAMKATLVQQASDSERRRPYEERRQLDEIEAEAADLVRR
jgi:hypothetical protein